MRACFVAPLVLIFCTLFPASARASGIVDLQFTGDGHTIAFSLPDTTVVMDHPHIVWLGASALGSIDGIPGYPVSAQFVVPIVVPAATPEIILDVPSNFGGEILLWGPIVLTRGPFIPISNPTYEHPDDLLESFIPGTYQFTRYTGYGDIYAPPSRYTLTITPENSAVPEPASLVLLATGTVAVGGAIRSRMRG